MFIIFVEDERKSENIHNLSIGAWEEDEDGVATRNSPTSTILCF